MNNTEITVTDCITEIVMDDGCRTEVVSSMVVVVSGVGESPSTISAISSISSGLSDTNEAIAEVSSALSVVAAQAILTPQQFTNAGSRSFVLPSQPALVIATCIEYCGVTYRLIGNDYTISGTNLTLTNSVIAPSVGDTFLFIS